MIWTNLGGPSVFVGLESTGRPLIGHGPGRSSLVMTKTCLFLGLLLPSLRVMGPRPVSGLIGGW